MSHWNWVNILHRGIGIIVIVFGLKLMTPLPENPTWVHLAILSVILVVGGSMLNIPGFRGLLSKAVAKFVPKSEDK